MGKGEVEALRAALDQEIFCTLMQDGAGADNLAIAICSYFSDRPERPDLDPDDDEHGWGEWVMQQYESLRERLLDSAMNRVTARIDALAAENAALREGMNGDYDLDAWLAWRKEKEELRRAGQEAMRERAATRCKYVADCYGENANNPNLGATGQKAMLHKQAAAMDCYNAIRALPISEE